MSAYRIRAAAAFGASSNNDCSYTTSHREKANGRKKGGY
jgi:hypothetical protein